MRGWVGREGGREEGWDGEGALCGLVNNLMGCFENEGTNRVVLRGCGLD